MADNTTNSGSNTFLAFVLGGVVVVLAVFGYFYMGGDAPGANDAEIQIDLGGGGSGN